MVETDNTMFKIIRSFNEDRGMVFHIKDLDVGIVNSLRRVILAEIPNVGVAFDPYNEENNDIHFFENTSCLHNEFLGHRISLLPVQLSPEEIEIYTPDMFRFLIEKHNTGKETIDVTSDDIQIFDHDGNPLSPEQHALIFPKDAVTGDPILIVRLKPNMYNPKNGEKLHVEFSARLGTAKQHSRYCPVNTCAFFNVVDEEAANVALLSTIRDKETKKGSALTNEELKVIRTKFQVHDKYRHFVKNAFDEPSLFEFIIESECRLDPIYLFGKAFDILIKRLNWLCNDEEKTTVQVIDADTKTYAITLFHEDHTIGNLIQVMLYNHHIRGNTRQLAFVGYYLPHPLNPEIVVKLVFDKDNADIQSAKDVLGFFEANIQDVMIPQLEKIKEDWSRANATPQVKRIQRKKK
jgi:DNA-directed RNA polymerases I and III subunit RPAC1